MCMTIKESGFKKVAEEDMTVYKVIRDDNTSEIQRFPYEPGARYTLSPADSDKFSRAGLRPRKDDGWRRVYEGFHAYITKKAADSDMADEFNMADDFNVVLKLKVVAFTIPKGAKYYLGTLETIVSDTIIAGDLKTL